MNKDIEETLTEGWYNIKHGFEAEHQVLERAIKRLVKIKDISTEDVHAAIEALGQWHMAGLLTDPVQESPPPEGLLLRTSLLDSCPEWTSILADNPLAIQQTVVDPHFAGVVVVAKKFETAYDPKIVVKLFETCVEFYATRGADTANLGMKKSILFWDGLEDSPYLDEVLERQRQNLGRLYDSCMGKLPEHTLISYVRKNKLEEVAGQRPRVKNKPAM